MICSQFFTNKSTCHSLSADLVSSLYRVKDIYIQGLKEKQRKSNASPSVFNSSLGTLGNVIMNGKSYLTNLLNIKYHHNNVY